MCVSYLFTVGHEIFVQLSMVFFSFDMKQVMTYLFELRVIIDLKIFVRMSSSCWKSLKAKVVCFHMLRFFLVVISNGWNSFV